MNDSERRARKRYLLALVEERLRTGSLFFLAFILVKPIGVSTQFVILGGIVASFFDDELVIRDEASKSGYRSSNAYLNKSGGKYAKSVANPFNYSFIFVLCNALGGLLGRITQATKPGQDARPRIRQVPEYHRRKFGETPWDATCWPFAAA